MVREQQADGFTYTIGFWPAYDYRNDPEKKQFGQHVAELHMALVGPQGAVVLRVFTGWSWGRAQAFPASLEDRFAPQASGAGVSYHSFTGNGEGTTCDFAPGGQCWSEGMSFIDGDPIFHALVREGEAAVWALLRTRYVEHAWGQGA